MTVAQLIHVLASRFDNGSGEGTDDSQARVRLSVGGKLIDIADIEYIGEPGVGSVHIYAGEPEPTYSHRVAQEFGAGGRPLFNTSKRDLSHV